MAALKIPEMEVTLSECETVAKAYADVAEFYPALQQTAKAAAFGELIAALGLVYGTRVAAIIKNRVSAKPEGDNVVKFQHPGGPNLQ